MLLPLLYTMYKRFALLHAQLPGLIPKAPALPSELLTKWADLDLWPILHILLLFKSHHFFHIFAVGYLLELPFHVEVLLDPFLKLMSRVAVLTLLNFLVSWTHNFLVTTPLMKVFDFLEVLEINRDVYFLVFVSREHL